jgi:hypothetical protein
MADVGAGLGAGGGGGSVAVACAYAKLPRRRLLKANFAANFMPDLNWAYVSPRQLDASCVNKVVWKFLPKRRHPAHLAANKT